MLRYIVRAQRTPLKACFTPKIQYLTYQPKNGSSNQEVKDTLAKLTPGMQKQIDLKVKTTGTPATAAAASTKNNLKESEDDINAPRGLRDNPFEKLAKGGRKLDWDTIKKIASFIKAYLVPYQTSDSRIIESVE